MDVLLHYLKIVIDGFLDIGMGATVIVGLLIEGGEFIVLTLVFFTIIFVRKKWKEKFIKKVSGSYIFIFGIIGFAVIRTFYRIFKRGELDFSLLHSSEKIVGAMLGWVIILFFLVGLFLLVKHQWFSKERIKR